MNKISRTFTIESETFQIIEDYKESKNLSSYSSALERIVMEWAINKKNEIDID